MVAVDPGKVSHRVWLADRERGLIGEPVSVANSRVGMQQLAGLVGRRDPVFALEATGSLHRAFAGELERRWPGALRLFAPSETQAARAQIGARRFKTDDRDCAALVWLARQGAGRRAVASPVAALLAAVAHRRQLVLAQTPLRQRLHDQLNALAPGLSAPEGHGRALLLQTSTGRAVLACAIDFEGRAPSPRSLQTRAGGRLSDATAGFWSARWKDCLAPPADAALRASRLARDVARFWALREDIAFLDAQLEQLLAESEGQVLTSLPGVKVVRAAAFAAHSLPIERFPTPEHLYSATGLAPASYASATVRKRTAISRTGLPEHRDALMAIAWGLGRFAPAFQNRRRELAERGLTGIRARVALARHACRLCWRLLQSQQPYDDQRYDRARRDRGR
ncbi:transposase [Solirubrobacter ginsenosidimutans]|uniref:transposase n=1 Tax=Solirubrobacter ginsenosidimutans TaxID=490573 RepID=UPI0022CE2D49|nr:transposase [Solirubrobacter ginsenosidimutans]